MGRRQDPRTREEKFSDSYTVTEKGCWEFKTDHKGYGRFYHHGAVDRAHRVSWEIYRGPIPAGMMVRHKCDNPPCANPDHLELGSAADNARDAVLRRRTLVGEKNTFAKLTTAQVQEIRAAAAAGDDLRETAAAHGTSLRNIRNIVNRKTWTHV